MSPMMHLLLASAAFLATHFISSTPLRAVLVAALGRGYIALYSLLAFATLGWMIWAFNHAPFVNLWYAVALRAVPLLVMPFAFVFVTCGVLTPNPTAVGQEGRLKAAAPAHGILRVTRHPVMWGFALWGASHVVARGDASALIFFGTFVVLALAGTQSIDRRKRAALGDDWRRFAAATSNVPFAAIAAGRNEFRAAEIGWWKIVLGLVAYAVMLTLHFRLFGVHALL